METNKSISTLLKVNITENEEGIESTALTISTSPAKPDSYILEFMNVMTVVSRKNIEEALNTIKDAASKLGV